MNRLPLALIVALYALGPVACSERDETGLVGTLERDRVEIRVESNEPIVEIHVADGQPVTAGTPILSQDASRAEAALRKLQGIRDQAAARLAELRRGPRPEIIREARAQLDGAVATRINAESELKRTRDIFDRGLSSEGVLDAVAARFETASAQEQAAREGLERLLNGSTIEELQQAEAALAASEGDLASARIGLDRTRVLASVDGTVDKVLYQVGERPAAGTTIAVILDSSRVFARVYVPEPLRADVQPGDRVTVRIDGVERSLQGSVRWVSSDASFTPYFALTEHDRSRLSYLAEVDVPDAADLPSGLPLEVVLTAE